MIAGFIRNTERDLYDEKLEEILDLEWSKDEDTKTQRHQLSTGPLHRANAFNTNGPAQVKRQMQWEPPSKPLAVDDRLLLPEPEVRIEIGINWILDQDMPSNPKGGYVRISEESLVFEKRLGKTRIRTAEGFTTCMKPHRGWTIVSSSWNFLRKRWLDRQQELITVIHEQTKRTEENEGAGYTSPTWSILRALQKINNTKRLEGKAIMSAPPFFQPAAQRDLKFWREDDERTVVVWESLSESEQEQWSKQMGNSKDWVVWCRSREKDKEYARLKSMEKKVIESFQTAASKQKPK